MPASRARQVLHVRAEHVRAEASGLLPAQSAALQLRLASVHREANRNTQCSRTLSRSRGRKGCAAWLLA